jgi:hypothetical protein
MPLEDITTIFYKMDDFYQIHKEFVEELGKKVMNWSDEQRIAEAVKKLVGFSLSIFIHLSCFFKTVKKAS